MIVSKGLVEVWSRPTGIDTERAAFAMEEIGQALARCAALDGLKYVIRRTGSESNGTSIGNSDIDFSISLQLADNARLSEIADVAAYRYARWSAFRTAVHDAIAMSMNQGASVVEANKCLNITGHPDLLSIDISPSLAVTSSFRDQVTGKDITVGGIEFWTARDNTSAHIISYPAYHIANGNAKDERTNGEYKRVVRTLKSFKKAMVEAGELDPSMAHSHHLECLAYSTPDQYFNDGTLCAIRAIIHHVLMKDGIDQCVMASHRYRLFGTNTVQWNSKNAQRFFRLLVENIQRW